MARDRPVLNDQQCACIDAVLTSIAETRELIAKCKDCGIDMQRIEDELNQQEKLAAGIKRNFFPDRP